MAAVRKASSVFPAVLLCATVACTFFAQTDAFMGGVGLLSRVHLRASNCAVRMNEDELDAKKLARGVGGILGNLKSGQGLFGAETTTKYARQAMELVEDQVLVAAAEIRSEVSADGVKTSDKGDDTRPNRWRLQRPKTFLATTLTIMVAEPPADGKLDITVGHASVGEAIAVTVKPTQRVGLLLKAWAGENEQKPEDFRLMVRGVPVDPEAPIAECNLSNNEMIIVRTR